MSAPQISRNPGASLLYAPAETPAPVVPDAELDRLGRAFLANGGHTRLGPFEAFVRRADHQNLNIDAYRQAQLRRAVDLTMKGSA